MGRFCHCRFQELSPGRGIIEDIPYNDRCPVRCADLFEELLTPSVKKAADGSQLIRLLCDEFYPAHRGNAREGLAPETQGPDLNEVLDGFDLRGRVP